MCYTIHIYAHAHTKCVNFETNKHEIIEDRSEKKRRHFLNRKTETYFISIEVTIAKPNLSKPNLITKIDIT